MCLEVKVEEKMGIWFGTYHNINIVASKQNNSHVTDFAAPVVTRLTMYVMCVCFR